jgi:hypothetical protein
MEPIASLDCQPNHKKKLQQDSIIVQDKNNIGQTPDIKTQHNTNEFSVVDNDKREICRAEGKGFLSQSNKEEATSSLFESCMRNNNDFIGMLLKAFIANSDMTPLINSGFQKKKMTLCLMNISNFFFLVLKYLQNLYKDVLSRCFKL